LIGGGLYRAGLIFLVYTLLNTLITGNVKETQTLLERCQREARETIENYEKELVMFPVELLDTLISNTLKQAADALEGMKMPKEVPEGEEKGRWISKRFGYNHAISDAQKLLTEK
jgi:hypothetical protein